MPFKFSESDLYEPVKKYFMNMGYTVRGEVKGCDIIAVKEDELIAIELKKTFNLKLVYQALDRMGFTDCVYVAVPRPRKTGTKEYRNMLKLLKALGIGLITIAVDSPVKPVDILLTPDGVRHRKNLRLKKNILSELEGRTEDYNTGGAKGVKIITAYHERCVKIACILEKHGLMTAKSLVRDFGCEIDSYRILYTNRYGWFNKAGKGLYGLTDLGRERLTLEPCELVQYYRNLAKGIGSSLKPEL